MGDAKVKTVIKNKKCANITKSDFLILIKKTVEICNSVIKNKKGLNENNKLTKKSIREKLFSGFGKDNESATKLGINTKTIDVMNVLRLLENSINKNYDKTIKQGIFKNPFVVLYEASVYNQVCLEDMRLLYDKIKELYDTDNPYYWFDLEKALREIYNISDVSLNKFNDNSEDEKNNLFKFYGDVFWYYFILLVSYKGLYYNKNNIREEKDVVKNRTVIKFEKTLSKNSRLIVKSEFRAGKTTFLKDFLNKKGEKIYYFNSNNVKIEKAKILSTFRPYAKCWTEVEEIKEFVQKYKKLSSVSPVNEESISVFFKSIPDDNVLIIDHISEGNLNIINELDKLKCKIVFVPNMDVDTSEYDIEEFFYDNSEVMKSFLAEVSSKNFCINNQKFKKLKEQLGNDAFVYKFVATAHKIFYEKWNNFDLIKNLCKANNFDDYDSIFDIINSKENKYKQISYNYDQENGGGNYFYAQQKQGGKGKYLDRHIAYIYEDYFEDIEYKLNPSDNRENEIQLHLLRLLCRLKNKDVSYSEVKKIWDFEELSKGDNNIYNKIEKLGWVKDDKICIPDIIAYAFNRRDSINKVEYREELGIRYALNYFITFKSHVPTNCGLYCALFECFLEDFYYLENRANKINAEYSEKIYKTCKKNEKIASGKRKGDFEPVEREAVLPKFLLLKFLLETLTFSLRYNKPDLWKSAKKILAQEEPNTFILDLVNKFDASLNPKFDEGVVYNLESYRYDGSAQIFLMESFSYFLSKEVLRIIKNINSTDKTKEVEICLAKSEIKLFVHLFYEVIDFYKNLPCQKEKKDKKGDNSLQLEAIYYKIICGIYDNCLIRFDEGNVIDYLQKMEECYHGGKLNTKIYENLIVLVCVSIMSFSVLKEFNDEQRKDIKDLVIDLIRYEKCAGDLPVNISEIVKITKEFLSENNLLD